MIPKSNESPETASVLAESLPPSARQASPLGVLGLVAGAVFILLTALIGLDQATSGHWRVQRSILVNAPFSRVHSIVNDLRHWNEWAQWNNEQLFPKNSIAKNPTGKGARLRWTAEAKGQSGASVSGQVAIVREDPRQGIWFETTVNKQPPSHLALTYKDRLGATEVTWTASGELRQFLAGLSVARFQEQLHEHIEAGLLRLKTVTEASREEL